MFKKIRDWLAEQLAINGTQQGSAGRQRARFAITCFSIFLSALTVRLLHWQDSLDGAKYEAPAVVTALDTQYKYEVRRMIKEGGILFPRHHDPGDARMLNHPPGYAILLMALYGDNFRGHLYEKRKWLQIICDSVTAVLIFMIAAHLLPLTVAVITGMLVALSPHFAFYSLWGTPDSLSTLPILLAVYLLIRAIKRPRLITLLAAGAMVGLSCWLRANAMLLAPFLAVVSFILFPRGKRLGYSLALVAATIIVIAPITIRNWVVFHHFVPLSLRAGIALVEGIAEYDKEDRFGMPSSQHYLLQKDAEWHGRPDYSINQWRPDGIKRDQYRFDRGLQVIRENPFWFLGVMIRRAGCMLRYNDSLSLGEVADTAKVPAVSAEPSFGSQINFSSQTEPAWQPPPSQLIAEGKRLSNQAQASLAADSQSLVISGDGAEYGDQFTSAPIPVKKDTDYVMRVSAGLVQGSMAVKVTTPDRRIMLSRPFILSPESEADEEPDENGEDNGSAAEDRMRVFDMPFASGNRSQVLLVVSNNGRSDARPVAQLGAVQLFELGPTPHLWMRHLRPPVRGIQRNLFRTEILLPLAIVGLALLALAGKGRELLILLAVPAYYLSFQSAFYTEYRYVLVIHYFLFVLAAVALYCASAAIGQNSRPAYRYVTRGSQ